MRGGEQGKPHVFVDCARIWLCKRTEPAPALADDRGGGDSCSNSLFDLHARQRERQLPPSAPTAAAAAGAVKNEHVANT